MANAENRASVNPFARLDAVYMAIGGVAVVEFAMSIIQDSKLNPNRLDGDVIGVVAGIILAAAGIVLKIQDHRATQQVNQAPRGNLSR
jgi:hypothetical protein